MNNTVKGTPLGPRVLNVTPNDNYELLIVFDNGEQRKFDAKQLFGIKAFEPLKSLPFFKTVRVEFGTVSWGNDIDYCPDTLYMQSISA